MDAAVTVTTANEMAANGITPTATPAPATMEMSTRADTLKVAYLLHRFPVLSETFILRELYWVREHGIDVTIFSLLPAQSGIVHREAEEVLSITHYSPLLAWPVIHAQAHFLRRSPRKYLRALAKTISQTYREPLVLARSLILFPKSVYFARQMQELGIEHIHSHFVWLGGVAAEVARELVGLSFSLHPHAFDLFERDPVDVRRQLESATQVVTISRYNRAYIAQLCPALRAEDVEVVYYGVDTEFFKPADKVNGRGGNGRVVQLLSVGRLIEKKGFAYLIDACRLLVERGYRVRCQIVGDGPLQKELQAQIDRYGLQEVVILRGALNQNELLALYQSSEIFAMAVVIAQGGDRDGIPNVLAEAMACELPVVTTAISGIPDLVEEGVNGLFVEPRSAESLANALEKLANAPEQRAQLGAEARQSVLQLFQIQRNTEKLATIFRRVVRQEREAESV